MKKLGIVLTTLLMIAISIGSIGCNGEQTTPTVTPSLTPTPTGHPIILIQGEEDTSPRIHMVALNVMGNNSYPIEQTVQGRIDEINSQGGLAIIAHPISGIMVSEAELKALRNYLGIELDYTTAPTKWDAVLTDRVSRGEPLVWGFMTDDAHSLEGIGTGFIMLRTAKLSKDNVLAALKEGSFYWGDTALIKDVSLSGNRIAISLTSKGIITFIKQGGQVVKTVTGTSGQYTVSGDEGYIRVDVEPTDPVISRAGTQPFRIMDASSISNPYAGSGDWYKGNLHCHTTISDGALSPNEAIALYEEKGYSFLAITDHIVWNIPGE
jgi:hypothetical protein